MVPTSQKDNHLFYLTTKASTRNISELELFYLTTSLLPLTK